MAKLTKLRSALKKMNYKKNKALSRVDSGASSPSDGCSEDRCYDENDVVERSGSSSRLQRVYVGRSKKEYHVAMELLDHPVVKELVVRTSNQTESSTSLTVTIGCEAVLFDHLLWMLEDVNLNPAGAGAGAQIEPLDVCDLARFYAY